MDEAIKYISSLGTLGVLVALIAYIFWKHIPNIVSDFRASLAEQRADFKLMIEKQSEICESQYNNFEGILRTQKEDHEKQMEKLSANFDKITKTNDAQTTAVNNMSSVLNNQSNALMAAVLNKNH